GNVVHKNRPRQKAPLRIHSLDLMTTQPLAARHARHVREEHFEEFDFGMGVEEGFDFLRIGNAHVALSWEYSAANLSTAATRRSICALVVVGQTSIII